MNNQRMIALAQATAEHLAAKRKEHQQARRNQCPSCGQDMREEPREDCPQCGQSLPASWRLITLDDGSHIHANMKTLVASTRLKPSEIRKLNRIAKRQGMKSTPIPQAQARPLGFFSL